MIRTPFAVLGLSAAAVGGAFLASGTASAAPVPAETAPVAAAPATYTVVSGDSLWAIGQRYGIPMSTLAADNDMNLDETLAVGKILTLSGATAAPSAPSSTQASPAPSASTEAASTSTGSTSTFGSGASSAVSPSTSTSVTPGSSLEACIINSESRGNAEIMNSSGHWGLYQFSEGTWIAYGGSASDFGSAPASVQQQVFDNAIAHGGASNWTAYDGC